MRWRHLPIVAFDTETTGLDPFGGDRIIEFAAVVLQIAPDGTVDGTPAVHSWLINPGMPIPRISAELTGISDRDVAGKPPFSEVASDLRALLTDAITVAHNYPFDMNFLSQEFARIGQTWPEPLAEVDTVDVSRKHQSDAKDHKLASLVARLGITLEGAHRAANDAEACGRAFLELARRHDVPDDLQAMLDWAGAIGRPPEEGPFTVDANGRVVFREGPHADQPVGQYPVHLHWMTKARARGPAGWDFRFAEDSRRWARRWLEVRGAGRARASGKTVHVTDWGLDPCIAPEP